MWIKGLTNWVRSLFPSSDFSRNVGLLAGSTALAQAIALLTSPILTRIYTPEDFGVLAVFTSFLTMLTVVATLRYDMAIPLPEHDDEAVCVLHLCFIIVICSVAMVGLGAWGTGYLATSWATVVSSALYVWLLLIAVFGAGVYQTFRYWAVRKGAFGAIARSTISQGLGRGVAQVGLGFLGIRPLGLLVGQVLGQILGGGSLALITWRGNHQSFIRPNVRGIIQAEKSIGDFHCFTRGRLD